PLSAPDGNCRALLSLVDGRGKRMLWLQTPGVQDAPGGARALLGLLLSDSVGLADAIGSAGYDISAFSFPAPAPVGTLHTMRYGTAGATQEAPIVRCFEVSFSYGLRTLCQAVGKNWATSTPLPVEYQLLFEL